MDITPHLTLRGTLRRNTPARTAGGGLPDVFTTVKSSVPCRIGQPRIALAVLGYQDAADAEPVVMLGPEEDVREGDRLTITGGDPAHYIGSVWDLRGVARPSVRSYTRATGRRVQTGAAAI